MKPGDYSMPSDIIVVPENTLVASNHITADTSGIACEAFWQDRRARQLVERSFLTTGETVYRFQRHAPEMAAQMRTHDETVAFRNALIHNCDDVSYPRV